MTPEPRACPFCLSNTVTLLANFHDSLTAYRCETCWQVFYTVELRFAAAQPVVEPLQQKGAMHLRTARPSQPAVAPAPIPARRLSFGRVLRRP